MCEGSERAELSGNGPGESEESAVVSMYDRGYASPSCSDNLKKNDCGVLPGKRANPHCGIGEAATVFMQERGHSSGKKVVTQDFFRRDAAGGTEIFCFYTVCYGRMGRRGAHRYGADGGRCGSWIARRAPEPCRSGACAGRPAFAEAWSGGYPGRGRNGL